MGDLSYLIFSWINNFFNYILYCICICCIIVLNVHQKFFQVYI